jgi:hypothetical protein
MIATCGAYCGTCEWKPKTNCPGCLAAKSEMFWGVCAIAKCAIARNIQHCGVCPDVPCANLQRLSQDPDHGDNGERLANLKAWSRGELAYKELTKRK